MSSDRSLDTVCRQQQQMQAANLLETTIRLTEALYGK